MTPDQHAAILARLTRIQSIGGGLLSQATMAKRTLLEVVPDAVDTTPVPAPTPVGVAEPGVAPAPEPEPVVVEAPADTPVLVVPPGYGEDQYGNGGYGG